MTNTTTARWTAHTSGTVHQGHCYWRFYCWSRGTRRAGWQTEELHAPGLTVEQVEAHIRHLAELYEQPAPSSVGVQVAGEWIQR